MSSLVIVGQVAGIGWAEETVRDRVGGPGGCGRVVWDEWRWSDEWGRVVGVGWVGSRDWDT